MKKIANELNKLSTAEIEETITYCEKLVQTREKELQQKRLDKILDRKANEGLTLYKKVNGVLKVADHTDWTYYSEIFNDGWFVSVNDAVKLMDI